MGGDNDGNAVQIAATNTDKLLNELIEAIRCRTKYQEAALFHRRSPTSNVLQKRKSDVERTWTAIVKDIYEIVPMLSDEEFSLVSKLLSFCLLSYLLPQTTRFIEIKITEGNQGRDKEKEMSGLILFKNHYSLKSLEDVLDKSTQSRNFANSQYDPSSFEDEFLASSFWDFIHNAVGPFLSSRAMSSSKAIGCNYANCGSSDLLHVLSIAISGDIPKSDYVDIDANDDDGNELKLNFSERVKDIINYRITEFIQISPRQRAFIVHTVSNSLLLQKIRIPQEEKSLLTNGILHLRAAMRALCNSAMSNNIALEARQGLVNSAIDTEIFAIKEMKTLVSLLVESKAKRCGQEHNCRCRNLINPRRRLRRMNHRYLNDYFDSKVILYQQLSFQKRRSKDFCPSCDVGDMLVDLILRYNGARFYADSAFTSQTLMTLTIAIATLLPQIVRKKNEKVVEASDLPMPCIVSSILDAAGVLFYFLLNEKESEEDPEYQQLTGMKYALLECVTQMLGSPDHCIATSSSFILALALAYENGTGDKSQHLMAGVMVQFRTVLESQGNIKDFVDLIEVMSRSKSFSNETVSALLKSMTKQGLSNSAIADIIKTLQVIASHQNRIVSKHIDSVDTSVQEIIMSGDKEVQMQWSALRITCINSSSELDASVERVINQIKSLDSPWYAFNLSKKAMSTANFKLAEIILSDHVLPFTKLTSTYNFLSLLAQIYKSESTARDGITSLSTALSYIESAIVKISLIEDKASFQVEYISLRKDFLRLCLTVCNLCAELRLSNQMPKELDRASLHHRNVPKCFYMIAKRFHYLYERYGLFRCQHTRTTIRTQCALAKFMGDCTQKILNSTKKTNPLPNKYQNLRLPHGDKNRVLIQTITKLQSSIVENFDDNLEPSIRGSLLSDIVDAILKCSNFYPRDFPSLTTVPVVSTVAYYKSHQAEPYCKLTPNDLPNVQLGYVFQLRITGSIPSELIKQSTLLFSQMSATLKFPFRGSLQKDVDLDDVEDEKETTTLVETVDLAPNHNSSASFLFDFHCPQFQKLGCYSLHLDLIIRDVTGGEYRLVNNFQQKGLFITCKSRRESEQ